MINYKKLVSGAFALSMLISAAGCGEKKESGSGHASGYNAGKSTEEPTPPAPVEAEDENAVTFDNGDLSFAEVVCDDSASAEGELSVVEVQGNKMLKFTDSSKLALNEKVQKVKIDVNPLIGAENLDKVYSIEFDVYADAISDKLVNDNGESVKAPGWIGGGGGTVTAKDGEWYNFSEFSGGEYNCDMSGAVHGQFKFLLAADNQKWSSEMEEANFLIMRWGCENESNFYIDNIVFYDKDGKSIPLIAK